MTTPLVVCRVCGNPVPDAHSVAAEEGEPVDGVENASGISATEVPGPAGLCAKHRGE